MEQINATRMPSYCHSGESCSICFQPLVEKFRCIDCLKNQVCKLCWLHTVGHTCIFLKDERHSARTIVLKNWHIPVDWVDSFSHWIWRHNSTLRVCKGFPIYFMTMGRKSQYNMALLHSLCRWKILCNFCLSQPFGTYFVPNMLAAVGFFFQTGTPVYTLLVL